METFRFPPFAFAKQTVLFQKQRGGNPPLQTKTYTITRCTMPSRMAKERDIVSRSVQTAMTVIGS